MFYRIIGLLVCLFPMIWGTLSIHAGIESATFGPVLGGLFIFIIGLTVFWLIVYDIAEQIVNVLISEPDTNDEYNHPTGIYDPETGDFAPSYSISDLNVPDPNLVHPDDAKRAARLNIKV